MGWLYNRRISSRDSSAAPSPRSMSTSPAFTLRSRRRVGEIILSSVPGQWAIFTYSPPPKPVKSNGNPHYKKKTCMKLSRKHRGALLDSSWVTFTDCRQRGATSGWLSETVLPVWAIFSAIWPNLATLIRDDLAIEGGPNARPVPTPF